MNSPFVPKEPNPLPLVRRGEISPILLCFSHLRWNFVFQRPQHLMTQAAASFRVYYIEEPVFEQGEPHYRMRIEQSGVTVLTPVFDHGCDHVQMQKDLALALQRGFGDAVLVHWFYTPMAWRFARHLDRDLCVYDCMDELSAFRFAPVELRSLESELLSCADFVFTGGRSLYTAKRMLHPHVHCFPSSVDVGHFGRARSAFPDPLDQMAIPRPRIGFFGVIDERMDLELVAHAAHALPDVQFVMIGPTAKIDVQDLPKRANLHWLGRKPYEDLPAYISNWQAAWMPFALNEATRFISPTKTPEFLAAGLRVTATAVADVVSSWARDGLVAIADKASIAEMLQRSLLPPPPVWRRSVDQRLGSMSWRGTWAAMQALMTERAILPERV
jgi:glycosyltransferase involved in cell wall biosynthesis